VALTRAAEGLARATGQDPAAPPPPEPPPGPPTPEQDAAQEADARAFWEELNQRVELRAAVLARQILQDANHTPLIHSGFAFHWRAENLGPAAAAADREAGRNANWGRRYWREDGTLRPIEEIRANTFGQFRQKIRTQVGLPMNGDPWGDRPVYS